MNIRDCPICGSTNHHPIFDFDYEYVSNVLSVDKELLDIINFKLDSVSTIVKCTDCHSSYVRNNFEVDLHNSEYFEFLSKSGKRQQEANTKQGKPKSWDDKSVGKELVNNSILNIIRAYIRKKTNSPIGNNQIQALDFGCGWGGWLKNFKNYEFINAHGFDINKNKVESVKTLGLNASSDIGEIRKLGPYDIIICNDVLEHVESPRDIIDTIESLLKPDGILYAAVPRFTISDMRNSISRMKKGKKLENFHLGHINYMTPEAFKGIMTDKGFQPFNSQTVSISWTGGINTINLIRALKSLTKIIHFMFSSKYCNTWTKQ